MRDLDGIKEKVFLPWGQPSSGTNQARDFLSSYQLESSCDPWTASTPCTHSYQGRGRNVWSWLQFSWSELALCRVGSGKSSVENDWGYMVKPDTTRKPSLCTQKAVLSVLASATPELHSEENHANQSADEKRSVKRENQNFFVAIHALCIFILHLFILYVDQEHHPLLIFNLFWHFGESNS